MGYFGTKDFLHDPRLAQFSVAGHMPAEFPALFISAGNGDSLPPDSLALAETATRRGVIVDTLFFSRIRPFFQPASCSPSDPGPSKIWSRQITEDPDVARLQWQWRRVFVQKRGDCLPRA